MSTNIEILISRKYISGFQIFYEKERQRLSELKIPISKCGSLISKLWYELSIEERNDFEQQFLKHEIEFQKQTMSQNTKHIEVLDKFTLIPPKPKKPLLPIYQYCNKQKRQKQLDFPNETCQNIYQKLIKDYSKLNKSEKYKYEREHQRALINYETQLSQWEDNYSNIYKDCLQQVTQKFEIPIRVNYIDKSIFPKRVLFQLESEGEQIVKENDISQETNEEVKPQSNRNKRSKTQNKKNKRHKKRRSLSINLQKKKKQKQKK